MTTKYYKVFYLHAGLSRTIFDNDKQFHQPIFAKHQLPTTNLPTGCIIAAILLSEGVAYSADDPCSDFAFGPIIHSIVSVLYLPDVEEKGRRGQWYPEMSQDVLEKVQEWKRGIAVDGTIVEDSASGIPAISVQQPFANAMKVGTKDVENRKRRIWVYRPKPKPNTNKRRQKPKRSRKAVAAKGKCIFFVFVFVIVFIRWLKHSHECECCCSINNYDRF